MPNQIRLGRTETLGEMAAVAACLAFDEVTDITGQTLFIDGRLTSMHFLRNVVGEASLQYQSLLEKLR